MVGSGVTGDPMAWIDRRSEVVKAEQTAVRRKAEVRNPFGRNFWHFTQVLKCNDSVSHWVDVDSISLLAFLEGR